VAYFCKYLSICCLGSTNPSQGDRNSGEDGFPYIDRTGVYPLVAGMQSGPGMASASLCGLMNVAADKRSDDCATLPAALLLTRLQLHLGISERTREGRVGAGARGAGRGQGRQLVRPGCCGSRTTRSAERAEAARVRRVRAFRAALADFLHASCCRVRASYSHSSLVLHFALQSY
jgi:hypothetical protein